MTGDGDKSTLIKIIVLSAVDPNFSSSLTKLAPDYTVDSAAYGARTLTTEQLWASIRAVREALSAGKSARHKRLYEQSKAIVPSTIAASLREYGIKYKKDGKLKPEEPLAAKIIGSLMLAGIAAFVLFLAIGAYAMFTGGLANDNDDDVWRYKACKNAGDFGDRWDCEKRLGGD